MNCWKATNYNLIYVILLRLTFIRQCRMLIIMIFIEASIFTKLISKYLSDDEYRALQWYLMTIPDAGDIVRGSGGVRKYDGNKRKRQEGWG